MISIHLLSPSGSRIQIQLHLAGTYLHEKTDHHVHEILKYRREIFEQPSAERSDTQRATVYYREYSFGPRVGRGWCGGRIWRRIETTDGRDVIVAHSVGGGVVRLVPMCSYVVQSYGRHYVCTFAAPSVAFCGTVRFYCYFLYPPPLPIIYYSNF